VNSGKTVWGTGEIENVQDYDLIKEWNDRNAQLIAKSASEAGVPVDPGNPISGMITPWSIIQ
jgi:hypothetical protein